MEWTKASHPLFLLGFINVFLGKPSSLCCHHKHVFLSCFHSALSAPNYVSFRHSGVIAETWLLHKSLDISGIVPRESKCFGISPCRILITVAFLGSDQTKVFCFFPRKKGTGDCSNFCEDCDSVLFVCSSVHFPMFLCDNSHGIALP